MISWLLIFSHLQFSGDGSSFDFNFCYQWMTENETEGIRHTSNTYFPKSCVPKDIVFFLFQGGKPPIWIEIVDDSIYIQVAFPPGGIWSAMNIYLGVLQLQTPQAVSHIVWEGGSERKRISWHLRKIKITFGYIHKVPSLLWVSVPSCLYQ